MNLLLYMESCPVMDDRRGNDREHQTAFDWGQSSDIVCYSDSCGLGSKITCFAVFALFL